MVILDFFRTHLKVRTWLIELITSLLALLQDTFLRRLVRAEHFTNRELEVLLLIVSLGLRLRFVELEPRFLVFWGRMVGK